MLSGWQRSSGGSNSRWSSNFLTQVSPSGCKSSTRTIRFQERWSTHENSSDRSRVMRHVWSRARHGIQDDGPVRQGRPSRDSSSGHELESSFHQASAFLRRYWSRRWFVLRDFVCSWCRSIHGMRASPVTVFGLLWTHQCSACTVCHGSLAT